MAGLAPIRVQGCEPGCEHEWADGPKRSHSGGTAKVGLTGGGAWQEATMFKTTQGAYCIHCGGWRGGLGLEPTIEAFIGHLILCLREWHRILRDDSCAWVNLGDSYVGSANSGGGGKRADGGIPYRIENLPPKKIDGLQPKNLMMIPARFALAAQADGWYLRSAIVWAKGISFRPDYAGSSMPSSAEDRPANSYEMVYMLSKQQQYYFDMEAVKEPAKEQSTRNLRSVWVINPQGWTSKKDVDHFACWPEALVTPMIKAATSAHGVCAKCSAPWRRVVESDRISNESLSNGNKAQSSDVFARGGNQANFGRAGDYQKTTTGWIPSCACYGIPIPARLDFPDQPEDAKEPSQCDECDGVGYVDTLPMLAALGIEQKRFCEICLGAGHIAANDAWLQWKAECDQIQRDRLQLLDAIRGLDLPVVPAVVCDPFNGSGTSGRAALKLGRSYIGVDISQEYLTELSPDRMSNIQMELAL